MQVLTIDNVPVTKQVSSHLQAPVTLSPTKQPQIYTESEAGWVPQLIGIECTCRPGFK